VTSVNVEHGVSADKANITAHGPRMRTGVVESPSLSEHSVGGKFGTIRNGIADKVGLEALTHALGGEWLVGGRLKRNWCYFSHSRLGLASLNFNRFLLEDGLLLRRLIDSRDFRARGGSGMITQGDSAVSTIITYGAYCHSANGSLELDQGVGLVVVMSGQCLAVGTEIDIVTDGTLVADTGNIALGGLVLAKRSITEDTEVSGVLVRVLADSLVDRNKSMARVVLGSIDDAVRAVIPIGTGQTLVAGTNNTLLTAVTDGGVLELTAGKAAGHDQVLQAEVAVRAKGESVGRVVTMLISQKAAETQVIVLAVIAADQVAVISFCMTALALSSGARGKRKYKPRQHPLHIGFSSP
jgi:hypothetical protein